MKTVFSGIQPSGLVHLGNLLGAINNWAKLSNEDSKNYFCIVALHSLTAMPNKSDLKDSIKNTLKVLLASGINLENSVIYVQSDLKDHAYLSWILSNFCQVGELQRMTQFKEKASSFGTHSGLLTYPILMAADILIHKANEVPVGDDQTQHLELTRNIAERFNNNYGEIFPIPEKTSGKYGARLMSLRHPENKMSKSSDDINGTIYFNDSKDSIIKKFKSSVTDSSNSIAYDIKSKAGISNLIEIYSSINNLEIKETEKKFNDYQYGEFKIAVAESVISYLEPINEKFNNLGDKEVDFKNFTKGKNEFSFTLPNAKREITFKILTHSDDKLIDAEARKLEKVSSSLVTTITSRMKRIITSIDGNSEQAAVSNFVDNEFLSMDSLELRKHMVQITPDVNLTTTAKFDDGREEEVAVEITAQFFWPTA